MQQRTMKDLEKAPSQEEDEVDCLLDIDNEECNINKNNKSVFSNQRGSPSPLSFSIPMSPKRRHKSHKYLALCILIMIIALITVMIPVSHDRLSTTIKTAFKPTAAASTNIDDDHANKAATSPRMHVDYHTNRFNYSSSWCPNANCKGTSICYPCQRRWLIIVATGRSASTTLTEMVARLPRVRMTGENNNLITRFENLLKQSPEAMLEGKMDAWFHENPIPEESFSCASQTLFTTFNPPKLDNEKDMLLLEESDETTILGFKTIRLFDNEVHNNNKVHVQELANAKIVTLDHLFPCARFVVNYRSAVMQQLASQESYFGVKNKTQALQMIQLDNDLLRTLHTSLGRERSFLLDSTIWTQNISVFNEMLDWLGFATPACHFPAPLEYNTGGHGYEATKTEVDLDPNCMYLY